VVGGGGGVETPITTTVFVVTPVAFAHEREYVRICPFAGAAPVLEPFAFGGVGFVCPSALVRLHDVALELVHATVKTVLGTSDTDCRPLTVSETVGVVGAVDVEDTSTLAVVVALTPVWNETVNVPAADVYVCGVENGGGTICAQFNPALPPSALVPSPHMIV
jgi:hypothetical protein